MRVGGGGRSVLSVVHAENVADGIVRAARTDIAGGRAYNLANDYDVTVAEFFRLAGDGLGRQIRLPTIPYAVARDRKSTRLNSSHQIISYAVFCLKKKNTSRHAVMYRLGSES